ncbi:YoaK family protein [Pantoea anthophila]|uniref:YoaK family protein n=1 Tax=Pantoea anthophila TaxID=470931 RepID=UPI00301A6D24
MLISTESARSHSADTRLACTLAAAAGALNTAAFEIVGFFSANMTGNVSLLSDHLAKANPGTGLFFLAIVILFIAGSALSTLVINSGRRRNIRTIYAFVILAEGAALMVLGVIENHFPPLSPGVVLILSLSFLMGLQNAVVTRISDARVRTTHVSGTATDIGIELVMLFEVLRRKISPKEAPLYLSRLRLHVLTLLAFLAGGIAGIGLYRLLSYDFLLLVGFGLICLALNAIFRRPVKTAS